MRERRLSICRSLFPFAEGRRASPVLDVGRPDARMIATTDKIPSVPSGPYLDSELEVRCTTDAWHEPCIGRRLDFSVKCGCYDPPFPAHAFGGRMNHAVQAFGEGDVPSWRAWLARAGVLAAMFIAAACTTQQYAPAPASLPDVDYNYHIGPSDTVNVIVWRNPELSGSVPVRPDGKITTPLIEDLPAQGRTPSELARDMEKALGKYIRDPVVTVIVTGFVGPTSEQIRVIGEAAKPQILPYKSGMSVLDVMIAVGGLTDFADGNGARIMRPADGGKLYTVRLRDLLKRGDVSANVAMRPGDILVIPQSWF
jgi:polysaccharide export outer membrane protein